MSDFRQNVAVLSLTTWFGTSIGARHVYLNILYHDKNNKYKSIRMENRLACWQAKEIIKEK